MNDGSLGGVNLDVPPPSTAIVRPLRHVKAVLGETNMAPVTDRVTAVPPCRSDIEGEIAVADERRLRGDRECRADGAATVLRWLIGEDDHVPVRGPDRGELVGGFGDIVRSPSDIAKMLFASSARDEWTQNDATGYLNGVIATFRWVKANDRVRRGPTPTRDRRERFRRWLGHRSAGTAQA